MAEYWRRFSKVVIIEEGQENSRNYGIYDLVAQPLFTNEETMSVARDSLFKQVNGFSC